MTVPSSTGIGAPGTNSAPANLSRSPMSASGSGASTAIPFTRGSSLATMQDWSGNLTAGLSQQIQLQTNAFLENLIFDFSLTTSGNSATVTFAADGPFNAIANMQLTDPAGQSIITPITGYQWYLLNKYLLDTDCNFDPAQDPNYLATAGTPVTGGSFSFRLVLPVEHRRRDALGAVNNSAANQRYLVTLNVVAAYSTIYGTAPTTEATNLVLNVYQQYWTSPPATITTSAGSSQVQQTPSGLGTVGFVRYELHTEVSGGGAPQIQLNNVGDYISDIVLVLRSSSGRDVADWPAQFDWWVNDFQVHALTINDWQRGMHDDIVVLQKLHALFDEAVNFGPANQYLPTDATTKLQIRGSTWGASASKLEVITRMIRPVSGAALFA